MDEEKKQEQLIGKITHYFGKIGVGVIEIVAGELGVGDTIRIQRGETSFKQVVDSMQVDHNNVATAETGQSVGLKVDQPIKEGDAVYKILEE